MTIERGSFYLADLNPRRSTEPGKRCPVLVLQSHLLNRIGHPSTIVAPLTTAVVDDAEPLRVRVPTRTKGFRKATDILIDQVRSIDNKRLLRPRSDRPLKKIGQASDELMRQVESCLKLVLDVR